MYLPATLCPEPLDRWILYGCTVLTYHEILHPAPLRSTRLLDQLRERIRYRHLSLSTEHSYAHWIRSFVRFHGLRHPRELGGSEVEAFLSHLVNMQAASASTHKQALAALLFLHKHVIGAELPWMQEIGRPQTPARLPVVLSREEVSRLLAAMRGVEGCIAQLLYGTGLRKMECLRLRIKDLDFDRGLIIVREGKGNKDRVTMLPVALAPALRQQLAYARSLWGSIAGVFKPVGAHTRCATHSRRICLSAGRTSERFRNCSATATWIRR